MRAEAHHISGGAAAQCSEAGGAANRLKDVVPRTV